MSRDEVWSWLEGPEALSGIAEEWARLCDATGADLYLSPAWVLTWWEHFAKPRDRLCTLTARAPDGGLVALLPMMVQTLFLGPLPVRIARLAATDPHAVVLGLPVPEDLQDALVERAIGGVLEQADLASFTPASDRSPLPGSIRTAVTRLSDGLRLVDEAAGSHTLFDLPESFDGYLATLSKKRRAQVRRDIRALADRFGLRKVLEDPGAEAISAFVTFHALQWKPLGKGGHFADWPGSAAFYRDLAERLRGTGQLWLDHAIGNNGPLATQFGLRSGRTFHWRLPARTVDPEAERLSVGKTGLVLMIERLIGAGVRRIEGGVGSYEYKTVLGAADVPLRQLIVTRPGRMAEIRLRLLLGWGRVLHLGYYRLWFCRLAPWLRRSIPLPVAPLRRVWIRTRV